MKRPTLEDILEYAVVIGFVRVASWLSAQAAVSMGGILGRFAFDCLRFRRRVTLSNITRHLPEAGADQALRIARGSYVNFGRGLAEFARLPGVDIGYITRNIRIYGLKHLDDAVRSGKGAILLTGHFGSWELMGCVLGRSGYPVKFVVGIQRNLLVQDLMNRLREASGIGVIELTSVLETVRHIRAGGFIAMLSDQDAGRRGVFVEFMGTNASTPKGAARLALATGAPIIPGFIVRSAGIEHIITIEKPIHVDGRGDRDTLVRRATQQYTKVIEDYVRRYPDHWLWAHRRWKTHPPSPQGSGLAF